MFYGLSLQLSVQRARLRTIAVLLRSDEHVSVATALLFFVEAVLVGSCAKPIGGKAPVCQAAASNHRLCDSLWALECLNLVVVLDAYNPQNQMHLSRSLLLLLLLFLPMLINVRLALVDLESLLCFLLQLLSATHFA